MEVINRRKFLTYSAETAASLALVGCAGMGKQKSTAPLYKISLAEWSFHRRIQAGELEPLDFARTSKELGIHAVEYVNQFFMDKAQDNAYLTEMKTRAEDVGVTSVLIMIDREGQLGDPDDAKRTEAIENHKKWVEAAKFLGCHSIRVNAASSGTYDEQSALAADGLRRLTEFANPFDINVIVENHGGLSSNGAWLAATIQKVAHPRCGTLPDFGNFRIDGDNEYDRYRGVRELMPFAKGVSAKSYDFSEQGEETQIDFLRMMRIVVDAGYSGHVGVEYEGRRLAETDGVLATKALLEKVRDQLTNAVA